jgi:hypothetical protein
MQLFNSSFLSQEPYGTGGRHGISILGGCVYRESNDDNLGMVLILLTSGCIMIDTELQLPDEAVKPMLTGEDCVGIYFGIGVGNVRMNKALRAHRYEDRQGKFGYERVRLPAESIRRIHAVVLKDVAGLGCGERCLEVTGEP